MIILLCSHYNYIFSLQENEINRNKLDYLLSPRKWCIDIKYACTDCGSYFGAAKVGVAAREVKHDLKIDKDESENMFDLISLGDKSFHDAGGYLNIIAKSRMEVSHKRHFTDEDIKQVLNALNGETQSELKKETSTLKLQVSTLQHDLEEKMRHENVVLKQEISALNQNMADLTQDFKQRDELMKHEMSRRDELMKHEVLTLKHEMSQRDEKMSQKMDALFTHFGILSPIVITRNCIPTSNHTGEETVDIDAAALDPDGDTSGTDIAVETNMMESADGVDDGREH